MDSIIVGKKIKSARLNKGLTQKELAKLLDISESGVNKWEKGIIKNISYNKLAEFAKALGVSVESLQEEQSVPVPASSNMLSVKEENIKMILDITDENKLKDIYNYIQYIKTK